MNKPTESLESGRGPNTIILHVGLHKTGSTSIQNCAEYRHREFLLQHGIRYGEFRLEGKPRPNHGGPVAAALCEQPDKYGRDWRQKLHCTQEQARQACRHQLDGMLNSAESATLLLSGELFSTWERNDLELLRKYLEQNGRQLRVLMLVRNPLSFVESSLQQRVRAGKRPDPGDLASLQRVRYLRLRKVFGNALEVLSFDRLAASRDGLVGGFYRACGVPGEALPGLEYGAANLRSSLEAFRLMRAINERYPNLADHPGSALRQPRDLRPLQALPGARFTWRELDKPEIEAATQLESDWFAEHLDLVFPPAATASVGQIWSFETLACLESSIRDLDEPALREAAADFLESEAEGLPASRADTRTIMQFIVRQLRESQRPPPRKLQELGADYFLAGAQQAKVHSPELAVRLLELAHEIKPESAAIAERLRQWRVEHFMSSDDGLTERAPVGQSQDDGRGSSGSSTGASVSASRR